MIKQQKTQSNTKPFNSQILNTKPLNTQPQKPPKTDIVDCIKLDETACKQNDKCYFAPWGKCAVSKYAPRVKPQYQQPPPYQPQQQQPPPYQPQQQQPQPYQPQQHQQQPINTLDNKSTAFLNEFQ